VLFDAAGTLIELRETVGTVYARVAAQHGIELPAWRLDDAFGRILRQAPPRVFSNRSSDAIADRERAWWQSVVRSTFLAADSTARFRDFDGFFAALFEQYATEETWRLRPGVAETLHVLRQRELRTGIVSNFDLRLRVLLQRLEIDEFFDIVVLPADCGAAKPDARIFEVALNGLGLEAASVLYLGDDPERDGQPAQALGMAELDVAALADFEDLIIEIERSGLAAATP